MKEKIVKISQIEKLLNDGVYVQVQSLNGFFPVSNYIKKGQLETFQIVLENLKSIKVTKTHKFFQKASGWICSKDLEVGVSQLLCDDKKYYKVVSIKNIGYNTIVDITVDHEQHCYFGNGILNHNSGKSLVCAHLVKSCQQQGGIPFYIDTQAAISWQFMEAIGVDIDRVIYYDSLNTVERIYKAVEQLMYAVRLQHPDKPLLIIIDSLSAAVTEAQLQNKDYQNKGYLAAIKAKMNSEALAKLAPMVHVQNVALVITSQVRTDMNQMNPYMDPFKSSSGGMSLQFFVSSQIRLSKKGKIKQKVNGVQTVIGVRTKARIDKSRLGPAYRQCEFDVYYMSGIDNYTNWLETLKQYGLVKKGATKRNVVITYKDPQNQNSDVETFEQLKIPGIFQQTLRQNIELKNKVYDLIADLLILKYKQHDYNNQNERIIDDDSSD